MAGNVVRYYGVTECARVLKLTRQRVRQLHDLGKLPPPAAYVGCRPLWESKAFDAWAKVRALRLADTKLGTDPKVPV